MPVYTDKFPSSRDLPDCVRIGLINNMPDAALEATERQFLKLLGSAANGVPVHLSFYTLPDVPRNGAGRNHVSRFYSGLDSLWNSELDGLIVTGREPRAANLRHEPYWDTLTKVIEWAKDNTQSTVWSCLAAHAAILHMDGIVRRRSVEKRCGVLDCMRLSDHELMTGVPATLKMPHSRWNDVPESELVACGYSVLTQARDAGVDTFIKQCNSLFVFFQGHPEYESDTLLLEYRRDVGRYLRSETDQYPKLPQTYFDTDTADALMALRHTALSRRCEELLADVGVTLEKGQTLNTWEPTAGRVYSNWLKFIVGHKRKSRERRPVARKVRRAAGSLPS